jgi:hypothetical protein
VKKSRMRGAGIVAAVSVLAVGAIVNRAKGDQDRGRFEFVPDTLVLSRSVYTGNASTVTIGETLPPGCLAGNAAIPLLAGGTASVAVSCGAATAGGSYPDVFENDAADGSFGVTSPIFLDNITTDGHRLGTLTIPSDQIVTSFSSKSELALNLSLDGKSITFVGSTAGASVTVPGDRRLPQHHRQSSSRRESGDLCRNIDGQRQRRSGRRSE